MGIKCLAVCSLKLEVTLLPPNLRKSGAQLRFEVKPQTAFHLNIPAKLSTRNHVLQTGCLKRQVSRRGVIRLGWEPSLRQP
jgi:hypothetical protein